MEIRADSDDLNLDVIQNDVNSLINTELRQDDSIEKLIQDTETELAHLDSCYLERRSELQGKLLSLYQQKV